MGKKKTVIQIPLSLSIDIVEASALGIDEISFLVDLYYDLQDKRIHDNNRLTALQKEGQPVSLLALFKDFHEAQENAVKDVLARWAATKPLASWAMGTLGIGPVLASGLEAHIDISKAANPSSVWRFAGLDPTSVWGKGQKRPFNAKLKVLCWKIGQSFLKQSGRPASLYGKLYREMKEREVARSEAGDYATDAKAILAKKNFGADTDARKWYEQGKLPPAHLDARARRYAVKIFLSHWWTAGWILANPGRTPPKPWIIQFGGHTHEIAPEVPYPLQLQKV